MASDLKGSEAHHQWNCQAYVIYSKQGWNIKVSNPGTFYRLAAPVSIDINRTSDKGHRCQSPALTGNRLESKSNSDCTDTEGPVPTTPDAIRFKGLSRSAHRFPSRFGVKQDHGDPFGLSMVCAVVFHPGRYERACRSKKGRDYFRRRKNKSSVATGEKDIKALD